MGTHEHARPSRFRERPPTWPRRNEGNSDGPRRRWEREPEPFEDGALPELYPGSLAMEDMVVTDDDVATLRVLVRYTVLRLLLLSIAGALRGKKLRAERRIALEHLALLPPYDWERRSLERLAALCGETPEPELVLAAATAAEAAAKRSQPMGAFALYRTAYELAVAESWWTEAAQVARGIAQLARLEEARYSIRLWRRRALILEKRAQLAAEAAAEATAEAAAEATAEAGEESEVDAEAEAGAQTPAQAEAQARDENADGDGAGGEVRERS